MVATLSRAAKRARTLVVQPRAYTAAWLRLHKLYQRSRRALLSDWATRRDAHGSYWSCKSGVLVAGRYLCIHYLRSRGGDEDVEGLERPREARPRGELLGQVQHPIAWIDLYGLLYLWCVVYCSSGLAHSCCHSLSKLLSLRNLLSRNHPCICNSLLE